MTKIIFVEGISGVGKSTMVQTLSDELKALGYNVKFYLEGDYTNPIDFYHTAYLTLTQYENLCTKYKQFIEIIKANTIILGNIRLIRYHNGNIPLFKEPLLSELSENEFCYHPKNIIPIKNYIDVYTKVWESYNLLLDETFDFIIFDGSLLHHPINDMMNNYHITGEQAVSYITTLFNTLDSRDRYIFYLKTNDIAKQLKTAHMERKQTEPTENDLRFWKERYKNDIIVLNAINKNHLILDISNNNWDSAKKNILSCLL